MTEKLLSRRKLQLKKLKKDHIKIIKIEKSQIKKIQQIKLCISQGKKV